MDLPKAAREKLSSSPPSVTYLYDNLTNTKYFSSESTSFVTKTIERDLESGLPEHSFRSSSKSQVAPFRYRPAVAAGVSRENHYEIPVLTNDYPFLFVSDVAKYDIALHEENEFYKDPSCSNDCLNIPCVPDFNGSCSTLDFTLDGDQWIDKRKIPATTTAKRSGRRPVRDCYEHEMEMTYDSRRSFSNEMEKTYNSKRNFTKDFYRTEEMRRDTPIRSPQCIPNAPQFAKKNLVKVEVYPGEFMRLRGADETWHAIKFDFYMPCVCICCDLTLFCIQDAIFVLCPICRIVSPMDGVILDGYDGGVGLGFTLDELSKWQKEIAFGREGDSSVKSISKSAREYRY